MSARRASALLGNQKKEKQQQTGKKRKKEREKFRDVSLPLWHSARLDGYILLLLVFYTDRSFVCWLRSGVPSAVRSLLYNTRRTAAANKS